MKLSRSCMFKHRPIECRAANCPPKKDPPSEVSCSIQKRTDWTGPSQESMGPTDPILGGCALWAPSQERGSQNAGSSTKIRITDPHQKLPRYLFFCFVIAIYRQPTPLHVKMPENKVISEPVAIGAARRYLRNEQAAQKRAALSRQVTTPKGRPRETFRAFCRREGLPYSSVYKHYRSLKETGSLVVSPLSKGRPRCLTDAEDTALVAYIVELEKAGVFASIPMIVAGANKLRAMRRPPAPPVNKNWFTRWKKDHGELRTTATDPMEVSRLSWEAQSEETSAWYRRANEMAVAQEITASACWNADEMGARLGCRDGRIKVVIVAKKRHKKPTTLDPANRESCTIVGAGNAEGETIPALCIFKQWPTTDWADSGLPGETTFVRSDTGFSNLEIMLTWIRHFNRCSWPLTAGVRRRGLPSIEDWFGYPADRQFDFLMDRFDQDYLDSGMVRSDGYERIWRWLILVTAG
ncbi:hypothetical protein RB593_001462 [Gaeumannomyces tritici]